MTSDLLTEHSDKPGYWKIYGRADDQIMHNTGEKVRSCSSYLLAKVEFSYVFQTNPGPLGRSTVIHPEIFTLH